MSAIFGFAMLSDTFSMFILQTQQHKKNSQFLPVWKLGNCQHLFSGISLKKTDKKKKTNERTKAFYCPVYMKVYVCLNIEKKCIC